MSGDEGSAQTAPEDEDEALGREETPLPRQRGRWPLLPRAPRLRRRKVCAARQLERRRPSWRRGGDDDDDDDDGGDDEDVAEVEVGDVGDRSSWKALKVAARIPRPTCCKWRPTWPAARASPPPRMRAVTGRMKTSEDKAFAAAKVRGRQRQDRKSSENGK